MLTAHPGLAIRQPPCSITRDIVVNREQNSQILLRTHSNLCYIYDNTIIDWMLLNFTPVIQQNCQQHGRKLEKSCCPVDRFELLSWAVKFQNQPIQKRSCFWYRKVCACNLLTWGLNVVLRYFTSSDFCVAKISWASNVPKSSRCWQHHSNNQITARLFRILQDMPCD